MHAIKMSRLCRLVALNSARTVCNEPFEATLLQVFGAGWQAA